MATKLDNPFAPGTGSMPWTVAGRDSLVTAVMDLATPLCLSAQNDNCAPNRDVIVCGPGGIGKTVLLRAIESALEERFRNEKKGEKYAVLRWTAQICRSRESATKAILPKGFWKSVLEAKKEIRTVLFRLSFDPSSQTFLSALSARLEEGPLVILIDDAQTVKPAIAGELLRAGQLLRSQGKPLLLVLAGTERLVVMLNKIDRTLLMRNAFFSIGPLNEKDAREAVVEPLKSVGARPQKMDILLRAAEGNPYCLQELGDLVIHELNRQKIKTVTMPVALAVQKSFKALNEARDSAVRTLLDGDVSAVERRKRRVKALESEGKRLDKLKENLSAEEGRLERQRTELQSKEQWIEGRRGNLESDKQELEKRRKELGVDKEHVEQRLGKLESDQRQLEDGRLALDLDRRGLEKRREELEAGRRDIERLREEVETGKARLKVQWGELDVDKKHVKTWREELEAEQQGLVRRREQVDAEEVRLEGLRERLDSDKKGLDGLRAGLDAEKKHLEGLREQLDLDKERFEGERDKLEAENERLEGRYQKLESDSQDILDFYLQKKKQRPTRWQWLFGDDQPPTGSIK